MDLLCNTDINESSACWQREKNEQTQNKETKEQKPSQDKYVLICYDFGAKTLHKCNLTQNLSHFQMIVSSHKTLTLNKNHKNYEKKCKQFSTILLFNIENSMVLYSRTDSAHTQRN